LGRIRVTGIHLTEKLLQTLRKYHFASGFLKIVSMSVYVIQPRFNVGAKPRNVS